MNPTRPATTLSPDEQIAALGEAIRLADRPELDHLAVRLAELAVPPTPIHPMDWSPASFLRRARYRAQGEHARAALDALVIASERLPGRILELVVALSPRDLPGSIARAVERPDPLARRSAIRLIERDTLWACAESLHSALVCGDPSISRRAGHALLSLALKARDGHANTFERASLERGAARAAFEFEAHKDRNAMLAALLLITHEPVEPGSVQHELRELLSARDWAGHSAVRTAIRHNPLPALRASAWRWLRQPGVANASLDRVARAESVEEHEAVLRLAHLALSPARLRTLRASVDPRRPSVALAGLIPDAPTTTRLTRGARRGRVRLVERLGLGEVYTRALLEGLDREPDAVTRLACVRAEGAGVGQGWSRDPSGPVARCAATAGSLAGVPGSIAPPIRPGAAARLEHLVLLSESDHASVRRVARGDRARIDPWLVGTPSSRLSARRWLLADREGFLGALRARLEKPVSAVQGVLLARALEIAPEIEDVLATLVHAPDPRVSATAISACADLDGPASLAWIEAALGHEDARVRANAIDARSKRVPDGPDLMRADPSWHARMVELKDTPAHRERAGAVRSLLEPRGSLVEPSRVFEPDAVESLERMLTDDRVGHRRSGVWVAGRVLATAPNARLGTTWSGLADRIAELASDTDPGVRARARACCARLYAGLDGEAVA